MSATTKMVPKKNEIVLGIRNPQKRTVYPLSWHDTRNLQGLIYSTLLELSKEADFNNPEKVFGFIAQTIYQNIFSLINLVVDGEEVDEKDLSFEQVTEISNMIFDMNVGAIKNLYSLFQKAGNLMKEAVEEKEAKETKKKEK